MFVLFYFIRTECYNFSIPQHIKLMAASGLLLGTASIVCAMFIGIVTGGGYAAVMLAGKKLEKKDQFAFGPFLALGLAAAVFWGNQIAAWYLHFL